MAWLLIFTAVSLGQLPVDVMSQYWIEFNRSSYISLQFTRGVIVAGCFEPITKHYYPEFIVRGADDVKVLRKVGAEDMKRQADAEGP